MARLTAYESGAATHTPGPWSVELVAGLPVIVAGRHRVGEAQVDGGIGRLKEPGVREEVAANARLIAAAPEMLEALKAAERELQELESSDALFMARAAIDKAEGR